MPRVNDGWWAASFDLLQASDGVYLLCDEQGRYCFPLSEQLLDERDPPIRVLFMAWARHALAQPQQPGEAVN